MDWDIDYLLQNCLLTICVAIFIPAFLVRNQTIATKVKRYFYFLVTALVVEGLESYIDHVLGLVPDNRYLTLRIFVSAIGYSVRPIMMYIVLLLVTRRSENKHRPLLLFLPSLVTIVLSFMAFVTPLSYTYDENNNFVGGPFRYAFFAVLAVYFVLLIIYTIKYSKKDVNETKILVGLLTMVVFDNFMSLLFQNNSAHVPIMAIAVLLYFMYFTTLSHKEEVVEMNSNFIETEAFLTRKMLNESIETLAYTIDAKDRYTRGHSFRVAKYARQIATLAGKSEEDCRKVYLTGLLHDIGKISISDDIINKKGKLTDEEYAQIKRHPSNGAKILEKMIDFPFLIEGAKCHHERYDGKGYPEGLKGENIPEMGRIIAVADSYDAMTSKRTYRQTMDQIIVKQEIWKGIGTQFDPYFAKLMIAMIDADINYDMREKEDEPDRIQLDTEQEPIVWDGYVPAAQKSDNSMMKEKAIPTLGEFAKVASHWATPTAGCRITENSGSIMFRSQTESDEDYVWLCPAAIVYTSADGSVGGPDYEELAIFESAGYSWKTGSTVSENCKMTKTFKFENWEHWMERNKEGMGYEFSATRRENDVNLKLACDLMVVTGSMQLPEGFDRDVYFAVSGEKCSIQTL